MSGSSRFTQGLLHGKQIAPATMRRILNLWPPFLFTGIRCEQIAGDWRSASVRLKLSWFNRNAVGTHFGGSIFAMTDPFFMLLWMQLMGPGYVVWDRSAHIHFKLPGRGTLRARFHVDDAALASALKATANGDKYEPVFRVDVLNEAGETVASIDKQLYIRRKPQSGPVA